jgi:Glyoxalase/Bleomycin resistance protein/Dioxygenase superfamily.
MIDHIGLRVTDLSASRTFFEKSLAPLGYAVLHDFGEELALGGPVPGVRKPVPDLWLSVAPDVTPIHLSFFARDAAQVDAFHTAALDAGGTDNGAPGLRPAYGPGYYAAFALDPDGNNIEAVFHGDTSLVD